METIVMCIIRYRIMSYVNLCNVKNYYVMNFVWRNLMFNFVDVIEN